MESRSRIEILGKSAFRLILFLDRNVRFSHLWVPGMTQIIQLAQMNASIDEWGMKLGRPSIWYWVEAMIEGTARDWSKFLGGN